MPTHTLSNKTKILQLYLQPSQNKNRNKIYDNFSTYYQYFNLQNKLVKGEKYDMFLKMFQVLKGTVLQNYAPFSAVTYKKEFSQGESYTKWAIAWQ